MMRSLVPACTLIALLGCTAGCAGKSRSVQRGRGAGSAFVRSLARADVAVPLVVGLGLYASGWDDDLSDSIAGPETGKIGDVNLHNRQVYADVSDVLVAGSPLLWMVPTAINHRRAGSQVRDEVPASTARRLATGVGATLFTFASGQGMKAAVRRQRPDEPDNPSQDDSFPSGHVYMTSVAATLARHEIGRSGYARGTRNWLSWAATAVPVATAYLRVRAKRHYVSDVLVGYALGSFWGHFANEALLSPADPIMPYFNVKRSRGTAEFRLGLTFDI